VTETFQRFVRFMEGEIIVPGSIAVQAPAAMTVCARGAICMKHNNLVKIMLFAGLTLLASTAPTEAARKERLSLVRQDLALPGPPARVLSTDINNDGIQDLAVVVAYSERHQIGIDRIEGMVQFTEVIPAIFDHRELLVFLGTGDGTYLEDGHALELPFSVLSMEPGPAGIPIVAVTDDGLSEIVLTMAEGRPTLAMKSVFVDRPVLAGSGGFQSRLNVVKDLDGDGVGDIFFPSNSGPAIYLTRNGKIDTEPVQRLDLEGDRKARKGSLYQTYLFPTVTFLNGDDLPDLIFTGRNGGRQGYHVLTGVGDGRFEPLRSVTEDCWDTGTDVRKLTEPTADGSSPYPWLRRVEALKDLDGDRFAEAVTVMAQERGDSFRAGLKDAKKPYQKFGFHHLDRDMRIDPEPYFEMTGMGHMMESDDDEVPFSIEVFQDLDNDGRQDMVLVTLDFSVFQVVKIMATKKISIGLDFHVWHQKENGKFREVKGLDLSEKMKLDLNDLKLGRFAQFGGDFDGDGLQDFVHLGRGKKVTIHRGQPGCVYPKDPDLILKLDAEPPHLGLVNVTDLNGDGLSDIQITRPGDWDDVETTSPVTLELYLSGGGQ